jgi:hypothetical protein
METLGISKHPNFNIGLAEQKARNNTTTTEENNHHSMATKISQR